MMTSFPLSSWTDNAQYEIGRTYYDELNYPAAIAEFNKVLSNYATASVADEAQYYLHARSMPLRRLEPQATAMPRRARNTA